MSSYGSVFARLLCTWHGLVQKPLFVLFSIVATSAIISLRTRGKTIMSFLIPHHYNLIICKHGSSQPLLLVGSVSIDITGCTSIATKSLVYFYSLYLCLGTDPCSLSYCLIICQSVKLVVTISTVDHGLLVSLATVVRRSHQLQHVLYEQLDLL